MVSRRQLLGGLCAALLPLRALAQHHGHGAVDPARPADAPAAGSKRVRPEFNASLVVDAAGRFCVVRKLDERVVFQVSAGPGAAWSAPVAVSPEGERVAADGDARPKQAIAADGTIHVSWTRPLGKPYTGEIRHARSLDGGASFQAAQTVHADRQEITHRFDALAVTPGGQVVVAWIDKRDQEIAKAAGQPYRGAAVYFAVSDDRGQTFRGDYKLAEHSCECCRIALLPQTDGSLLAMWRHVFEPNIRDHAIARFWPDGRSEALRRVSFDDWRIDACPHHGPSLTQDGEGGLHAVWFADGAVRYGELSKTGAASPPPALARRIGGAAAEHADLLAAGRDLVIAWREFDGKTMWLKAMRSADGGASWREFTLASSAGPTGQPQVVQHRGGFHVFWHGRDEALRVLTVPA